MSNFLKANSIKCHTEITEITEIISRPRITRIYTNFFITSKNSKKPKLLFETDALAELQRHQ
jgi:hypothetical protein